MQNKILEFIEKRGHVSCVELCRYIDGFEGDREWYVGNNTVIWNGVSGDAVDAMNDLLDAKKIIGRNCSTLVYMIDGEVLNIPIAKQPKRKYKNPHWLPMTFSTYSQLKMQRAH